MSSGTTSKMGSEQASPVCTGSARSTNGNFTNTIEGGFSKLEEAALRCLQGMMPICFNGSKWMNEDYAVTAAFAYAKAFMKRSEAVRVDDEVRKDPSCEEPQQPSRPSGLVLPSS